MSHVPFNNESCHTHQWAMSHVSTSHITCINNSMSHCTPEVNWCVCVGGGGGGLMYSWVTVVGGVAGWWGWVGWCVGACISGVLMCVCVRVCGCVCVCTLRGRERADRKGDQSHYHVLESCLLQEFHVLPLHIYSYVWHDWFICVTWLICMCGVTHSCVGHDSFMCVTWCIIVIFSTRVQCVAFVHLFICVSWHILMCGMAHSNVGHGSFRCVKWWITVLLATRAPCPASAHLFMCMKWLIHMCGMPHSCVWHDSFIFAHSCVCRDTFMCVTCALTLHSMTYRTLLFLRVVNSRR